ncbi:inositol phosphate phosphatase SopB [Kistimonas asteriae]|uniref:inositol phosphate phosphatase SopB n=1 Tax=Kistimonas asteriae TaxID=517724 RepID=UPI001BAD4ACC|nr:inositol phosphate phosphatase SopB [Kistimonas asteriae]
MDSSTPSIPGNRPAGMTSQTSGVSNNTPQPEGTTHSQRAVKKAQGDELFVKKIKTHGEEAPASHVSTLSLHQRAPRAAASVHRTINPAVEQLHQLVKQHSHPLATDETVTAQATSTPSERGDHTPPASPIASSPAPIQDKQLKRVIGKPWQTFLKAVWNHYKLSPSLARIPAGEKAWLRQSFLKHLANNQTYPKNNKEAQQLFLQYLKQHNSLFQQSLPHTIEHLTHHENRPQSLLAESLHPLLENAGLTHREIKLVSQTAGLATRVSHMTSLSPYETLNSGGSRQPAHLTNALNAFKRRLDKTKNLSDELRRCLDLDITKMLQTCTEQEQLFTILQSNDFRTPEAFRDCLEAQCQAAWKTLANSMTTQTKQARKILLKLYMDHRESIDQQGEFIPDMVQQVADCNAKIIKTLEQAGLSNTYNTMLTDVLSKSSKAFSKQQAFRINGILHHSETAYCPAAQLRYHHPGEPQGERDPFEHSYQGRMSPSMRRDSDSAVNLYTSSLSMDGREVEKSVRVGIPYAYAHPADQRDTITHRRLNEALTALLLQHKAGTEELANAMDNPDAVIDMPVCYTNLMSPDALRSMGKHIPIKKIQETMDDERQWCRETWKSMKKHWQDKTTALTVYSSAGTPHKVNVNVEPFMFICPCNLIAHNKFIALTGDTWKAAEEQNRKALGRLIGSLTPGDPVEGFIGKRLHQYPPETQQKIQLLAEHMRELMRTGMHHCAEKDPFLYSRTLNALLNSIDMPVMEGCKSNKDRTGLKKAHDHTQLCYLEACQSDTLETDFIRRHIMTENPDFAALLQQMAVNGGHTTIQTQNTAMPGYRITRSVSARLDPIFELIQRGKPLSKKQEKTLQKSLAERATHIAASQHAHEQDTPKRQPEPFRPAVNAIDNPNRPLVPPV